MRKIKLTQDLGTNISSRFFKHNYVKGSAIIVGSIMIGTLALGCGLNKADGTSNEVNNSQVNQIPTQTTTQMQISTQANKMEDTKAMHKIKVTVNGKSLYGTLEDNATTKAMLKQFPLKLQMSNLYDREMTYRYGAGAFPTDKLRSDGYAVGDIVYWAPRGSFVILYKQNGEKFERQQLGHLDGDVSIFDNGKDAEVTFELAD